MEGYGWVVRIPLETRPGRVLAAGIVVEVGRVLKLETQRSPALLKLGARSNATRQLELGEGGRTRNLISQGHSAMEELGLKGLVGERVKGFVSGSSRATSQWVTHPGIALAPNSLNFGVPMTPKPVSSQKASC
ncbi:hypothetical protein L3X38_005352 [Prunus dulcis]|uniref:Uncharacterized protein n=1 Tax=Prunus dulcis TaxID=3755 RepID=A0AAD4ZQT4_PRUDU|nr:hypothetical protein L3X38_005352 [Prunus dulcis]